MTEATERRRNFEAETFMKFAEIDSQLDEGAERMERIEKKLDEVYEIIATAKSFFKVLGVIGKAVKWLIMMCGAIGAAWAAFTHRGYP